MGGEAQVGGTITALDGFVETSGKEFKILENATIKAGEWLIDPVDITIDDTLAGTIETALGSGDVTIETTPAITNGNIPNENQTSSDGDTTDGDIYVNSTITWDSAQKLTLNAADSIYINSSITATNAAGQLALHYGQGAVESGNTADYYVNAPINLKAGDNFFTKLGSDGSEITWKVITDLSDSEITLQGISNDLDGNYVLGANIDASATKNWNSAAGWDPLGDSTTKFTGNFDGLGHTIDSLYINRPSEDYVGLFGYTDGAIIKNIGLTNVDIIGKNYVGGLIGYSRSSSVSDSYSTGSLESKDDFGYLGGLIGYSSSSSVSDSYSIGSVKGIYIVGGLIGFSNSSSISNSYSKASVTSGNNGKIGGLIGELSSNSILSKSYSTGSVTSGDSAYVGGLVGLNNDATVSNSYSTGYVTGGEKAYIGGLVGLNNLSTVNNSYSTGSVTGGNNAKMGGLVGYSFSFDDSVNPATISNSYSTGSVTGGENAIVGGLVGNNYYSTVSNSFWDSDTTGQTSGIGTDNNNQSVTEIKSSSATVNAFSKATYTGFDFTNDWFMIENNTRPILRSEYSTTISTPHQLQLMAMDLSADYTLSNKIDMSATKDTASDVWNTNTGFNPIGDDTNKFVGTFDGLGNSISNLYINRPSEDYVGLFGSTNGATIKNMGLTNVNVKGNNFVGSLVGYSIASTIGNSYSTGSVESHDSTSLLITAGGLVGYNYNLSNVSNSYSTVTVTGALGSYVGGLVGYNSSSTISNSYSTGSVTGGSTLGGLVGTNSGGTITNSYYDKTLNTGTMVEASIFGKTTEELRDLAAKNWDNTIWSFGDSTIAGYGLYNRPYLKNLLEYPDMTQVVVGPLFNSGLGTEVSPYTITNWTQLQNIDNGAVVSGGYHYDLSNSIDKETEDYSTIVLGSNSGFNPIGDNPNYFIGTFDGLGNTISDLYIRSYSQYVGLFGYSGQESTIKNLGLKNVNISSYWNGGDNGSTTGFIGGLIGFNNGSVKNTFISGKVSGYQDNENIYLYTAGLIGWHQGSLENSYSLAKVSLSYQDQNKPNGLLKKASGSTVVNSFYDKTLLSNMADEQIYGKTTEELQKIATYTTDIEDENARWNMTTSSTISSDYLYPILVTENGVTSWKLYKVAPVKQVVNIIDPIKIITVPVVVVNNPTPNQNEIVLTQPIVQPANQVVVNDQNGNQINIASTPLQDQGTNLVTLSEIRNGNGNTNANPNGANEDVRIPLNKNSVVTLVNGGVNLQIDETTTLEQQYFVSNANEEN